MNSIKKLFGHSLGYFAGSTIIMLAGFISFPIWTRVLTVAEYGIFSTISITVNFLIGVFKLGFQEAALRFYHEYQSSKEDRIKYYSTLILGTLLTGLIFTVPSVIVIKMIRIDGEWSSLLVLSIILGLAGAVSAVFTVTYRADHRVLIYNIIGIGRRYVGLIVACLFVIVFSFGLFGLFGAELMTQSLFILLMFSLLYKEKGKVINLNKISFPFLSQCVKYGLPLMLVEFTNNLLIVGDRYMILFFLDSESVALYSAGYNLAQYSQMILYQPLALALAPMYLKIWKEQGRLATEEFLAVTFKYYLMFGLPMVFAFSYLGKDLLTLLASSKYQSSYTIVPYVCSSYFMFGLYIILNAGMYINKSTHMLLYTLSSAVALNMVLNIFLIPSLGIQGAAVSTLISYIALVVIIFRVSSNFLRIRLNLFEIVKYIVLSLSMIFVISLISVNNNIAKLFLKIITGCLFYVTCLLLVDSEARRVALKIKKQTVVLLSRMTK